MPGIKNNNANAGRRIWRTKKAAFFAFFYFGTLNRRFIGG